MKRTPAMDGEMRLIRRAFAAYFRAGGPGRPTNLSEVVDVDGKNYVHLVDQGGTVAVFGVDPFGRLKRLSKWPKSIGPVS